MSQRFEMVSFSLISRVTSSIPNKDAPLTHTIKQRLKSVAQIQLSKDLRELYRTCYLNIVRNGNQKFNLKTKGLDVNNRFSCQKYMADKASNNDITGRKEYRKYTIHNDRKIKDVNVENCVEGLFI